MGLFESNIEFLDKTYSGLGSLALQKNKEGKEELELETMLSGDGQPVFKISRFGRTWYLNGKRNALEPVLEWTRDIETIQRGTPISLIGIGNGLYLEQLAGIAQEGVRFLVYEPSIRVFLEALNYIDLKKISKHCMVAFVVEGINDKGLENMYNALFEYALLPQSYYFTLPNYKNVFPEEVLKATKLLKKVLGEKLVSHNTTLRFSDVVVQNLFHNMRFLPDVRKTSQLAYVIPRDVPAIVVAAGPSLNKNIEDLKLAKNKAFIIAADTAVKPLLKAGIVPDMFTIVDGKKPLELFKVEGVKEIPLVASMLSAKEVMEYHTGEKIIYSEGLRLVNHAFSLNNFRIEGLSQGGSVATAAFGLCYMLGIQTVILVGQDLALTGNKTHADGTFQDKMEELDTSQNPMVEGNYEELVPTRADFQNYLNWYNWFIEGCCKKDDKFRVINATEGGAKIKNTEIMTLKEAIERECKHEVNIQECIEKVKPMFVGEQREKVVKYLHELPMLIAKLGRDAASAAKLYDKLLLISKKNGSDDTAYIKVYDKLKKIQKKIESNVAYDAVRMCLVNAEFLLQNDQFNSEDSIQEEMAAIADRGKQYMELVQTCARLFQPLAEDTVGKVE